MRSPVTPEAARSLFWEHETSFGNVRRLDNAVILAAGNKYFGVNALYLEMSMDLLHVVHGELHVTTSWSRIKAAIHVCLKEWGVVIAE